MAGLKYLGLSLVLGALSVWGSENLFWMMPPPGLTPLDFGLTLIAYSVAAGVALSAVIWSGIGGISAAFLGGAVMGLMSEGVIVGTIYEGFPLQLVWTPLAWHGVMTGGVVLGLGRAVWPVWRMVGLWVLVGLAGAYWAQYWVAERVGVPEPGEFALYILGLGLLVPVAHWAMDRARVLPKPRAWVLWVAPGIAGAVWGLQSVIEPNPVRLVLPVLLVWILWVMWRLGGQAVELRAGPAARHLLFLIAPVLVVVLAPLGWAQGWGTLEANWVVAVSASLIAVMWLGRLSWQAIVTPRGP